MEDTIGFATHVLASLSLGFGRDPRNEAIVIFPGEYQLWRVETGIRVWSTRKGARLWVAGTAGNPAYTKPDILNLIREIAGVDHPYDDGDIECAGWASNTLDQAKWLLELLKANPEVEHLHMVTAMYHLPRAILTCLKQMILQKRFVTIRAVPILQGPKFDDPDGLVEMEKIPRYQALGHVATPEEFEQHLPRIRIRYL